MGWNGLVWFGMGCDGLGLDGIQWDRSIRDGLGGADQSTTDRCPDRGQGTCGVPDSNINTNISI